MKYPKQILMVDPEFFDVVYQINEHMDVDNKVDKALSVKQWTKLKNTYESLGIEVIVAPGDKRFPDMVFSANQLLTTPNVSFLSNMRHEERSGEVSYLANFLGLSSAIQIKSGFESMGDCIWDYDGERLFGGYGFRTDKSAYAEISSHINVNIIELELVNSKYYHLDTCLSVINQTTALFVASAFSKEGGELLRKSFPDLVQVDEQEAETFLACNAHCPDGKHILVEEGAVKLQEKCQDIGLVVKPINTSEFLKSGGSIFCLKNQGWF